MQCLECYYKFLCSQEIINFILLLLGKLQVACVLSKTQHSRDNSQIQSFLQQVNRETFEVLNYVINKFFHK